MRESTEGCSKMGREAHTREGKYLFKVQGQVRRASAVVQVSRAKDKGQKGREVESQAEVRL